MGSVPLTVVDMAIDYINDLKSYRLLDNNFLSLDCLFYHR
ncbi:hypothetical protein M595_5485 [Lyngbya aestuarii BL J]|uniref:Uncharacterized protein n=1 Tax=Lyngbya aestuarii BL J TaxID=1348334 RepID=U7Q9S0_9CYAN|nr:hypothetical protein M595_5485 [Lyngbya aestuarii BL J]